MINNYKILIREEAVGEIRQAYLWYENQNIGLGKRMLTSFEKSLLTIERTPMLFPVNFDNVRRALIKTFPFGILFEIIDEQVIILSFFHLKRDPKSINKKL